MFAEIRRQLRPALLSLVLFSMLLGLVYPGVITIMARAVFPAQAHGSLIFPGDCPVGSELVGQPFDDVRYFWGRPSATSPFPYNAASSSGSNLGPTNPALAEAVSHRIEALRHADPDNADLVPVDLVTASASGLDPHISPRAAEFQLHRVARARGMDEDSVRRLVLQFTEDRQMGLWGEPRVNVLKLNLALDARLKQ